MLDDTGRPVALKITRWSDSETRLTLGAQAPARIRSLQPEQGGAFVETAGKAEAFLRLPADHGLTEGQSVDVTVMAEARKDKLPRVSMTDTRIPAADNNSWREAPIHDVEIGDDRIQAAFDEASSAVVTIPKGGRLCIERARALTVVDIDSAGRQSKGSAASRALQLNLDAARELARQVGLRSLGGLVILDCVAPLNTGSRKKVQDTMKSCLEEVGLHTTTVLAPSKLGLMEIALPWRETPLHERTLDSRGNPTDETLALTGLRLLERTAKQNPMHKLTLELPGQAKVWLDKTGAPLLDKLSDKYGQRFTYLASTKPMPTVYQTA